MFSSMTFDPCKSLFVMDVRPAARTSPLPAATLLGRAVGIAGKRSEGLLKGAHRCTCQGLAITTVTVIMTGALAFSFIDGGIFGDDRGYF